MEDFEQRLLEEMERGEIIAEDMGDDGVCVQSFWAAAGTEIPSGRAVTVAARDVELKTSGNVFSPYCPNAVASAFIGTVAALERFQRRVRTPRAEQE